MSGGLTIVVAGDDLLFSTRIVAALGRCGHAARVAHTASEFQAALREGPDAGILDLASFRLDTIEAIREAKRDPDTRTIPLLGFCGHADVARQAAAHAAGCDRIAANAEVVANLPHLLTALIGTPRATPGGR